MKSKAMDKLPVDLKALIDAAVAAGREAGRRDARQERTAYQKTEARLYAIPGLMKKAELDQEELERLSLGNAPLPARSSDLARFTKYGSRLSYEDKLDAVIVNLKAQIAADQHEIETIKKALQTIEGEYYYQTVPARYFDKRKDEDVAAELHCDERTIRRQRSRLVQEISVILFGVEAIS